MKNFFLGYIFLMIGLSVGHAFCMSDEEKQATSDLIKAMDKGDSDEMLKIIQANHRLVNTKDAHENTSLHFIAKTENVKAIEALLSIKDIKLNEKNNMGETPLHLAVRYSEAAVKALLIKGVDVNVTNYVGFSALHYAIAFDQRSDVEQLLSVKGINIDGGDKTGETPLHIAVRHNSSILMRELLNAGANIDVSNNDKNTPLHIAVSKALLAPAEMLVKRGANINTKNKDEKTPLEIAQDIDDPEVRSQIIGILKKPAGTPEQRLKYAFKEEWVDGILEVIRQYPGLVNTSPSKMISDTPLHVAVDKRRFDAIEELLAVRGVDINAKGSDGLTPLQVAQKQKTAGKPGYDEIIKVLEEATEKAAGARAGTVAPGETKTSTVTGIRSVTSEASKDLAQVLMALRSQLGKLRTALGKV